MTEAEDRHAQAVETVRADLESLPDLVSWLPLFRLPGSRPADPNANGHSSPARPPLSLDVLDLEDNREKPDASPVRDDARLDRMGFRWRDRDDKLTGSPAARREGILPTLVGWCRALDGDLWDSGVEHREYGLTPCGRNCEEAPVKARWDNREGPCSAIAKQHWTMPTVAAATDFLLLHLDWAGEQQWFHELAQDVATMRADIRRAINDADPAPLHCPVCEWGVEEQTAEKGSWWLCTGCDRSWSLLEIHKLYDRQQPKTLAQIAELINRPVKTLHAWAKKRWIKPTARDGQALYSLAKVQEFAIRVQETEPQRGQRGRFTKVGI